jgi:biopolymer transport protein ExbB
VRKIFAALALSLVGVNTPGIAGIGWHDLSGALDEVEVASIVRPPDWVSASTRSQNQDSSLFAYADDTQREDEKSSYFKIMMQNMTAESWMVFIALATMFAIAMFIVISKALYLGKVKHANSAFLCEFSKLRRGPTLDRTESNDGDDACGESMFIDHVSHVKDGEDRFRMSTIYLLYHHGVQEWLSRIHTGSVGAAAAHSMSTRTFNSQTMNAVRTAMHAASVRMGQKLSSQMVLLAIAISGGPFLGLLGTAVGVMITFTAIAPSGDVNVNAIAPGIAAALAATAAGLAVAIPALFGYSWLNMKIKEINGDMRVFVDVFVTRFAQK